MKELMPGVEPPNGEDRPYSQPIKWIDWERRFGCKPPYNSPTEEFLHNKHLPTMDDLMRRWDGYNVVPEIWALYNDPTKMIERDKAQQIRMRAAGVPNFNDPEDVRIDTYNDLKIVQARIDKLSTELNQGYEMVVETSGSLTEGFTRNEVRRTLSAKSIAAKEESLRRFMETKRLLREQSTSISEVRTPGNAMRDQLREALGGMNHTTPGGYSWAEVQSAKEAPALPSGDIIEAEVSEIPGENYASAINVGTSQSN